MTLFRHPPSAALILLGIAGLTAGALAGLGRVAGLHAWPSAYAAAVFLAGFGVLKLGLGVRALAAWRGGGAIPAGHSGPVGYGLWIGFRFLVAAVALAGAAFLATSAAALRKLG